MSGAIVTGCGFVSCRSVVHLFYDVVDRLPR
jgi:hypothetical protein